jgi:activator of HSP90 ATPase
VADVIPATPQEIYDAWLDSEGHINMTGGGATASAELGARYTAWDGYITGENIELESPKRIVQTWRSSEFPIGTNDSRLEIVLDEVDGGTKVTFRHSQIPDGWGDSYKQGWFDHYYEPMKAYFGG